jgi:hypothetical protein
MTVTIAEANLLGSATEVAVTVIVRELATVAGAVYLPLPPIIPQLSPVQPVPETLQVRAWFASLGVTVAVNCSTPPGCTVTLAGETVTAVAGGSGSGG